MTFFHVQINNSLWPFWALIEESKNHAVIAHVKIKIIHFCIIVR